MKSDDTEARIDEAISKHETRNAALMRVFVEKGIDLSEARLIECHFWARDARGAADMEQALAMRGFKILNKRPSTSPRDASLWKVEAGIQQSINLTAHRGFTDELVRLAFVHSCEYDGWGCSV